MSSVDQNISSETISRDIGKRPWKMITTFSGWLSHNETHHRLYLEIIENDRLYFGRRDAVEPRVANRRMPISIETTIIPCLVMIGMLIRCLFSILCGDQLSFEDRARFGVEIITGEGRIQIEYCIGLWSILYLLSVAMETSRQELDFRYLSIWSPAREFECVGPWRLANSDRVRLRINRDRMATLEKTICRTNIPLSFVALFLSSVLSKGKSTYLLHPLAWFWLGYTLLWVSYNVRIAYGTPSKFTMVGYCLQLKQRALWKRVFRLGKRKRPISIARRLLVLNKADRTLKNELAAYNCFWSLQLSILVEAYILIITYLGYVLFMIDIPASYYAAYSLVFIGHIILLLMLSGICVCLVRFDRKIGAELYRMSTSALGSRRLPSYARIRLQDISNNRRLDTKCGFLIWNEHIIDLRYCLKIFASIVAVFLLTIKHQSIQKASLLNRD